ncbi:hypothetical protein, partial [Klebsiella pneumoniae]|uniref:hypothetical protein n=1 Tax=Klebsiella pneumoniae TaxID=573 RepID=UPI0034E93388
MVRLNFFNGFFICSFRGLKDLSIWFFVVGSGIVIFGGKFELCLNFVLFYNDVFLEVFSLELFP